MKKSIVIPMVMAVGGALLPFSSTALEPIALPNLEHSTTMGGTHFRIWAPGEGIFHFRRCTGLGTDYADHPTIVENFTPQATEENLLDLVKYRNPTQIVCKRHLTRDLGIWNWHAKLKPGVPPIRPHVEIALFSRGREVAWWRVQRIWPSKVIYSVEDDRFIEEVEFQAESIDYLSDSPGGPPPKPPGQQQFPIPQPPNIEPAPGYVTGPDTEVPPPGTQIEQTPGYVTGEDLVTPEAHPADLSGKWTNNFGSIYHFSQDGKQISYHDPLLNLPVTGHVEGNTVSVFWQEGTAVNSVVGTVTSTDSAGRATRIEWENGFVFHR
jgi:hypothetical protein